MSALKAPGDVIPFRSEAPALNPHDIAAEEAILGGLLIDPNAIARIEDILSASDFYLEGHQKIYAACMEIHREGSAIDMIGLCSKLADKGALRAVGGQGKIAALVGATVSAVNIDQHAALVLGKSRRRSLILAGSKLIHLGHDAAKPLPQVLDEAESEVFAVTQSVHARTPNPVGQSVGNLFSQIETRATTGILPGLSCGFYDIDAMTQGFQPGDLIIVAARPAMGKTSLTTRLARNMADRHKKPVLFFSLEMSEEQLLCRLLSAEARIEVGRLRAGRVAQNEWEALSTATSAIGALPLYIHDQPMISVGDIRHYARQAKVSHGSLGAVFIDYLQLMGGRWR